MIVYAEYVFLENFIMNFIILSLTAKFGKVESRKLRLVLASSMGALYAFILFFPSLHFMYSMLMKVACSMLIIIVGFSPYRFRDFFRLLGIFYLITLIFGGAAFALFYFTSFNGIISNGIFYTTNISLKNIMLSCGFAYMLVNFCWGYIQKQLSREKIYTNVKIEMNGELVELKGLVDTGNSLKDPITSYPVMIVEYDAVLKLFPEYLKNAFIGSKFPNFDEITMLLHNTPWMTRLRFIPFQALGTENGMLVGFKPDSVVIERESDLKNVQEIIIAIYSKRLSKTGDYRALLHPDLV
ncbi:sigma-E processing peptidase SpoIIGA [Alkaliphilus hydrothermalis]|uniref:Sporulation sigma-E factor-processing peptidase n=1 Tax=Alkaliphilus hydrothermalis TaxID=1482730 RepID=A0ABS2NNP9_9FIRM|nr:sigma-E processing peptidase SpoIIGA [Alkaliphilus hydrothermalis]MBM7614580.1 stage II sporulation protein GA (sporulation sigma-E factor processing peptidase) [Alkaliphilus hydrothermalis]